MIEYLADLDLLDVGIIELMRHGISWRKIAIEDYEGNSTGYLAITGKDNQNLDNEQIYFLKQNNSWPLLSYSEEKQNA